MQGCHGYIGIGFPVFVNRFVIQFGRSGMKQEIRLGAFIELALDDGHHLPGKGIAPIVDR